MTRMKMMAIMSQLCSSSPSSSGSPFSLYLSLTGQGRHVRSPSMDEKTMVGR